MNKLEKCPFCGGTIKFLKRTENIITVHTEVECMGCHMAFEYDQDFAFSKKARVAVNEPFETVWNRRVNNGKS